MTWRSFWLRTVSGALGLSMALYGAILIVDPYDTIFFSPRLPRTPLNTNQRFVYPALARSPAFDSAVFGTSTSALLRPALLNELFGGRFVNLSMASGTSYEQSRLFDLFVRHRGRIGTVIFGLDSSVWCAGPKEYRKFAGRVFPEWMYDTDRWNDVFNLYDLKSLEMTGRQLGLFFGIGKGRFGKDGSWDFLPPAPQYDLQRARKHIYKNGPPRAKPRIIPAAAPSNSVRNGWRYPAHAAMRRMLGRLPPAARKVLVFVPLHIFQLPAAGSVPAAKLRECKRRLTRIATGIPNAAVLDFMIDSGITRKDANYWDSLHYRRSVADQYARLIARGAKGRRGAADLFRYLTTGDFE